MRTKTYFIQTFGCAMNEYDSERIASVAESRGYIPCKEASEADLIIYNTCSVREKPYIKLASYLGLAKIYKKTNPHLIVGVTGCIAQQDGDALLKQFKTVDFVVGTDALPRIGSIIDKALEGNRLADTEKTKDNFTIAEFNRKPSIRANVTIMKGCENFCSYCIVPFVRGKEQSRKPDEIIDEVKRLADNGVKEICFLGQNVNSYGKELSCGTDFSDLLKMAEKIPSITRIRFVTSHPKDFSEKMVHTIAESSKICRLIHLPLQSGSDRILKAMNRKYTCAEYFKKIDYARKIMPDIGFTSDFITGFPGETEEDFTQTLAAVKYVDYEQIFAFNYSPRPGTAAERMGDTIDYQVKNSRLTRLFKLQEQLHNSRFEKLNGMETTVLVLEQLEKDGEISYLGVNTYNRNITFTSEKPVVLGDLVTVKISKTRGGISGVRIG